MRTLRVFLVALVAALCSSPLLAAAGSATTSEVTHTVLKRVTWSWTSGTGAEGGTVSQTTTAAFDGLVVGLTTVPSGAAAPTDNYDITITDSAGFDILLGAGANRDTANTEHVSSGMAGAAGTQLTLSITNAGDAKAGTVILWIR